MPLHDPRAHTHLPLPKLLFSPHLETRSSPALFAQGPR
ncbi:rCG62811 [Rattus norvegicus]|uniref:RCG62811 n=1 Tax=Rattus norvegicus TaxID=10116 RepID=A6J684_RAT|nr:rCG62811 [Rattus norvegicus]